MMSVTIQINDLHALLLLIPALTAFLSGLTAAINSFRSLRQSRANRDSIQTLHECVHELRDNIAKDRRDDLLNHVAPLVKEAVAPLVKEAVAKTLATKAE